LTIAALAHCASEGLVPLFYTALSRHGALERGKLDWETGDLYQNWLAIRPLLEALMAQCVAPGGELSEIVCGLFDYEHKRLQFPAARGIGPDAALASGDNWAAFEVRLDIPAAIERLQAGSGIGWDLRRPLIVVLVRRRNGSFAAYALEMSLRARLMQRDIELVQSFAF